MMISVGVIMIEWSVVKRIYLKKKNRYWKFRKKIKNGKEFLKSN